MVGPLERLPVGLELGHERVDAATERRRERLRPPRAARYRLVVGENEIRITVTQQQLRCQRVDVVRTGYLALAPERGEGLKGRRRRLGHSGPALPLERVHRV